MAQSNIPFKCPNGEFSCINVDPNGVLSPECSTCPHFKVVDSFQSESIDLSENIRIAAEVYVKQPTRSTLDRDDLSYVFVEGAKSQQAREYWYNEFEQDEQLQIKEEK